MIINKFILWLGAMLTALFLVSCQNGSRAIDEALDSGEEAKLIQMARAAAIKSKAVKGDEAKLVATQMPEVHIVYDGIKCGKARISWEFPLHTVSFVAKGEFLTPQMQWSVSNFQRSRQLQLDPKTKQYFEPKYDEQLNNYLASEAEERQTAK
ncbi:MAG: hypothetical protein RRY34_01945 [Victivallaceae bacterium]